MAADDHLSAGQWGSADHAADRFNSRESMRKPSAYNQQAREERTQPKANAPKPVSQSQHQTQPQPAPGSQTASAPKAGAGPRRQRTQSPEAAKRHAETEQWRQRAHDRNRETQEHREQAHQARKDKWGQPEKPEDRGHSAKPGHSKKSMIPSVSVNPAAEANRIRGAVRGF